MKYTFTNNEGHQININGKMTIEEMMKMGFTDFRLARPDAPPEDNWYKCNNIDPTFDDKKLNIKIEKG